MECLDFASVEAAHIRIKDHIHRTSLYTSTTLNDVTNRKLYFKSENLQKAGTYHTRGYLNAVSQEYITGVLDLDPIRRPAVKLATSLGPTRLSDLR